MPCYDLKCICGHTDEYIFSIYEELEVNTECSKCRAKINRKENRVYSPADTPGVKGETTVRIQK